MNMGDRIKQMRKLRGLTQEELAQKLGLKDSAIAKYESGRVENIKRSTISEMAKILDCSPVYLLCLDDESPAPVISSVSGIGHRIKELREKADLSQSDLAEKLHTTKQTIYKYETGIVTNIPSDRIELIASIFGCSPCYIMGWDNNVSESSSLGLSDIEKKIIIEYRRADNIDKEMVLRILRIDEALKGDSVALA